MFFFFYLFWYYFEKFSIKTKVEKKIPQIDCNIELLIGTNAHKIMEPWKIINSQGNGPYGWIINEPLKGDELSGCSGCSHAPTVNRISVASLEKLVIIQYNHNFSEKAS